MTPSCSRAPRWRRLGRAAWLPLVIVLGCAARDRPSAPTRPQDDASVQPRRDDRLLADLEDEVTADAAEQAPAPIPTDRPPQTIYRSEIHRALARGPGHLLRQLEPEPFRHQGHFVGWEIGAVFPDDPDLCAPGCDLEVGDVILSVAGDRLQTPAALSNLIEKLPRMNELEVRSLRDGKRRVVTYRIVDDVAPGR